MILLFINIRKVPREVLKTEGEVMTSFVWCLKHVYCQLCVYLLNDFPYCINTGATSHVLTDRNPSINKEIHVLLMNGFVTLVIFVPGPAINPHYHCVWSLVFEINFHPNLTYLP